MEFQLLISEHFVAVLMYLLKIASLQKSINLFYVETEHQGDGAGLPPPSPFFAQQNFFLNLHTKN